MPPPICWPPFPTPTWSFFARRSRKCAALTEQFLPALKRGAIVTDVGSVKADVVRELESLVKKPARISSAAIRWPAAKKWACWPRAADLYANAVCVVTPTKKSNAAAVRKLEQFWKSLGARTLRLDAAQHDLLVSRTSHLPHVVAAALANLVLDPAHPKTQAGLCATGFRDTTRIASGSPEMWRDIALANRKNLSQSRGRVRRRTEKIPGRAQKRRRARPSKNFLPPPKHAATTGAPVLPQLHPNESTTDGHR